MTRELNFAFAFQRFGFCKLDVVALGVEEKEERYPGRPFFVKVLRMSSLFRLLRHRLGAEHIGGVICIHPLCVLHGIYFLFCTYFWDKWSFS